MRLLPAMSGALSASDSDVVKRRDEALGELGVGQPGDRVELLAGHLRRPSETRGLLLVVRRAPGPSGVDRATVEAQRGDEAPLRVVGLERLNVGGEVDALGGQGGDAAAVADETHMVL
jgi:hypothetical protein